MSDLLYFDTFLRQVYVGNFTDVFAATLHNELETMTFKRNIHEKNKNEILTCCESESEC